MIHGSLIVHPARDAVAVGVEARRRELGEALDGVAVAPAALVLQRLRQVPVVERHDRLDAALEQCVDQAASSGRARAARARRGRSGRGAATRSRSGRR